jgi:3-deoxy-7-phosphoheptulonate synthase
LREVGDELGLPVVTEVMDTADLDAVVEYADALQIGARNMQNFSLLRAVGKVRRRWCSSAAWRRGSRTCCSPPNIC